MNKSDIIGFVLGIFIVRAILYVIFRAKEEMESEEKKDE